MQKLRLKLNIALLTSSASILVACSSGTSGGAESSGETPTSAKSSNFHVKHHNRGHYRVTPPHDELNLQLATTPVEEANQSPIGWNSTTNAFVQDSCWSYEITAADFSSAGNANASYDNRSIRASLGLDASLAKVTNYLFTSTSNRIGGASLDAYYLNSGSGASISAQSASRVTLNFDNIHLNAEGQRILAEAKANGDLDYFTSNCGDHVVVSYPGIMQAIYTLIYQSQSTTINGKLNADINIGLSFGDLAVKLAAAADYEHNGLSITSQQIINGGVSIPQELVNACSSPESPSFSACEASLSALTEVVNTSMLQAIDDIEDGKLQNTWQAKIGFDPSRQAIFKDINLAT